MIRIKSKLDGFRRCGVIHTGITEYEDNTFTESQIKEMQAEPMIVVEIIHSKPNRNKEKE